DASLFAPQDAYNLPQPTENGTPQPRDEPLAENQPYGAIVDYYIGKAGGPVTLEILNAAGDVLKKFSSDDKSTPVNPDTLDIPAFWIKTPPVLSTALGMHRWVWDLRPTPPPAPAGGGPGGGGRRGASSVLPGIYMVRLTAGGKSYLRALVVKMDPRVKP
ncbi:MAG: glycoside hydrolase, partial [Acidobacteriota bacterium]